MNTQEAFNKAVDHLLSMKEQARDNEDLCSYVDGCVIGNLMSQEILERIYVYGWDMLPISQLLRKDDSIRLHFFLVDHRLLHELQDIHDDTANWNAKNGFINFAALMRCAEKFELDLPDKVVTGLLSL